MAVAFTISLPAESPFRDLASDIARKYVEIVGGSQADAQGLASSVADEIGNLAGGDAEAADVELVFEPTDGGIEVTVRCDGRSTVVSHPLPARKR